MHVEDARNYGPEFWWRFSDWMGRTGGGSELYMEAYLTNKI